MGGGSYGTLPPSDRRTHTTVNITYPPLGWRTVINEFFYRPQTKFWARWCCNTCLSVDKEGFASKHASQVTWPGGLHPGGSASRGDTVNKRTVLILLECISCWVFVQRSELGLAIKQYQSLGRHSCWTQCRLVLFHILLHFQNILLRSPIPHYLYSVDTT